MKRKNQIDCNFYIRKNIKIYNRLDLETAYDKIGTSEKVIKRASNICIYCNKNFSNVKMNYAHLIPELLGKNYTHNEFECNECNIKSGKWETSLGTFTLPYRLIGKIKNKKGKIPKFKSRLDKYPKQTTIFCDKSGKYEINLATKDDYIIDKSNNTARIKFRLGGFNPNDVYKSFLKVALSLMPDEILHKERWMTEYLFEKKLDTKIFPFIYIIHLDDRKFNKPYFEIYQHKNGDKYRPKYLLTSYFGNTIIQIVLPIKKPKKKIYVNLPSIHKIIGVRDIYNVELLDLSNSINQKWDTLLTVKIKKRKNNLPFK